MTIRTIETINKSIEQSEGAGARVRRAIGNVTRRRFDPFLMMDHFNANGKNGFPEHPHRGQETISYILSGAFAHEDFTGSKGILYPGDLQFMTAGRGIVHSEMPVPFDGSNNIGIQLWVDLPNKIKDTAPRYRDLKEWEIPEVVEQDGKLKVKVISGKSYGVESVKELAYTPIDYYHYKMEPGANFKQEIKSDFNYFLYILEGSHLDLNGTKTKGHDIVFFNRDGDELVGENKGNDKLEFVVIGGQVQNQNSVQHGPFVAESNEKIRQAFQDYQFGLNGFENRKTWRPILGDDKEITQDIINNTLGGSWEKRLKDKAEWLAKNKA